MKSSFYVDLKARHSGVTGSCFHLKAMFPNQTSYSCIIDCGLFQGKDEVDQNEIALEPYLREAETLIITHNHADHIGKVPQLIKAGFKGDIITSNQTFNVLGRALRDCEKIERLNASKQKRIPHFKMEHVTKALRLTSPLKFYERFQIHPHVWLTLLKNAHVYGAAMVLLEIESGSSGRQPINFLFTGDYNDRNYFFDVPEIPEKIRNMPLHIICESTYGETSQQKGNGKVLEENISEQIALGKRIILPTPAFERGQILSYGLKKMQDSRRLSTDVQVIFDGKLFAGFTNDFTGAAKRRELNKIKSSDFLPQNRYWVENDIQRRSIIASKTSKIIVASGAMLSYGPSRAYFSSFINDPNAVIHFVAYQCEGSLGHKLKMASETGELLDLGGKLLKVQCSVLYTEEFSGHARRDSLIQLISHFNNKKSILLTHGTELAKKSLAKGIAQANLAKEVGIISRGHSYRFSPYKLEKIFPVAA